MSSDTIYALSSGLPPSGVAVIRLSGPGATAAVAALAPPVPAPRRAVVRALRGEDGAVLDRGMVLVFPAPSSFTGEDVAELHVHGGRAVVAAVLAALERRPGLRAAEAGEFTRRAFVNGRMDLTEVEGLADLIAAETEAQRRQALRQADGGLRARLEDWRSRLVRARALVEAELDFTEEEDVPGAVGERAWAEVAAVAAEIGTVLDDRHRGERLRDGAEVVVLGAPNAGKSSLVNALARRDVAIVTPEPGTTRDLIEVRLDLDGYPATVVDTAGLRAAGGAVEAEGIRRARERAASADLVLWLVDLTAPPGEAGTDHGAWFEGRHVGRRPPHHEGRNAGPHGEVRGQGPSLEPRTGAQAAALTGAGVPVIRVGTKVDLIDSGEERSRRYAAFDVVVSTRTGEGLEALLDRLSAFLKERFEGAESALLTRSRHRNGLDRCRAALVAALAGEGLGLEVRAEELRRATDALGRITGAVGVEDLLDVIFREFCIGK